MRNLLKKYKIYPSKRLGQNFLIDKGAVKRVIEAANLQPDDIVLEIGPGTGVLTIELAKRVKKVIAVEKDQKMIEILKETLKEFENVEIVQEDILKFQIPNGAQAKLGRVAGGLESKLQIPNYKVVGNLPFYLTAPAIRKFLEAKNRPKEMVLIVQKEVGQRICAKPPDMSILAVSVQFYAKPKIVSYISKKSFWPQPKVDSAIIRITPRQPAPYRNEVSGAGFRERFFGIVRAGFSQPRKQILNNFSKRLQLNKEEIKAWLLEGEIQPSQRAETLTIKDWIKLTKTFNFKYGS